MLKGLGSVVSQSPGSCESRCSSCRKLTQIGGSLTKLCFWDASQLAFAKFESIDQCFAQIRQLLAQNPRTKFLSVTGGGAFKYHDRLEQLFSHDIVQHDEMECLVSGLAYLITKVPEEVFTYEHNRVSTQPPTTAVYPYLLVNVGSGVSMVKVSGKNAYERVGGTSLGGGTFYGLLSLLTGTASFEEMLALSHKGNHKNVDMLVGDIYGTDYAKIGLGSDVIASSFGKAFRAAQSTTFEPADISASLLKMVSTNIAQIAYLVSDKHQVDRLYFGGSFIGKHDQTMTAVTAAIQYWSHGSKQACFLRHDGFLGALGACLHQ